MALQKRNPQLYQTGYANFDKITNIADVHSVSCFYGGSLETSQEENFQKYYDLCDVYPKWSD